MPVDVTLEQLKAALPHLSPEEQVAAKQVYLRDGLGIDPKMADHDLSPMQLAKKARFMGALQGQNVPVEAGPQYETSGIEQMLSGLSHPSAASQLAANYLGGKLNRLADMGVPIPGNQAMRRSTPYPATEPLGTPAELGGMAASTFNMATDPAFAIGSKVGGSPLGMAMSGLAEGQLAKQRAEAAGRQLPDGEGPLAQMLKGGATGFFMNTAGRAVGNALSKTPIGQLAGSGVSNVAGQVARGVNTALPMAAEAGVMAMQGAGEAFAAGDPMTTEAMSTSLARNLGPVAAMHAVSGAGSSLGSKAKAALMSRADRIKAQADGARAQFENRQAAEAQAQAEAAVNAPPEAAPPPPEPPPTPLSAMLNETHPDDMMVNAIKSVIDDPSSTPAEKLKAVQHLKDLKEGSLPAEESAPQTADLQAPGLDQSLSEVRVTPEMSQANDLHVANDDILNRRIDEFSSQRPDLPPAVGPEQEVAEINQAFQQVLNGELHLSDGLLRTLATRRSELMAQTAPREPGAIEPGAQEPLMLPPAPTEGQLQDRRLASGEDKPLAPVARELPGGGKMADSQPGGVMVGQPQEGAKRIEAPKVAGLLSKPKGRFPTGGPKPEAPPEPGKSSVKTSLKDGKIHVRFADPLSKEEAATFKAEMAAAKSKPAWDKDAGEWVAARTDKGMAVAKAFAAERDKARPSLFDEQITPDAAPEPVVPKPKSTLKAKSPKAQAPVSEGAVEGAPEPKAARQKPAKGEAKGPEAKGEAKEHHFSEASVRKRLGAKRLNANPVDLMFDAVVLAAHQIHRGAKAITREFLNVMAKAGLSKAAADAWKKAQKMPPDLRKIITNPNRKPGVFDENDPNGPLWQLRRVMGQKPVNHDGEPGGQHEPGAARSQPLHKVPEIASWLKDQAKSRVRSAKMWQKIWGHTIRAFVSVPELKARSLGGFYNNAVEVLRQANQAVHYAHEQAIKDVSSVIASLADKGQLDIFTHYIIMKDLEHDAEVRGLAIPGNFTIKQIKDTLAILEPYMVNTPELRDALLNHQALTKMIFDQLVAGGKVDPSEYRPFYFPHHIKDAAATDGGWFLDRITKAAKAGAKLEDPFRSYAMERRGSNNDIDTNYLDVMGRHLTDVYTHNRLENAIYAAAEQMDVRQRVLPGAKFKAQADVGDTVMFDRTKWRVESKGQPIELKDGQRSTAYSLKPLNTGMDGEPKNGIARNVNLNEKQDANGNWQITSTGMVHVPEGYTLWQPRIGREFQAIIDTGTQKVVGHALGRPREAVIIPEELARTLDNYRDDMTRKFSTITNFASLFNGHFKRLVLGFSPLTAMTRFLPYNLHNTVDDASKVMMIHGHAPFQWLPTVVSDLRKWRNGEHVAWIDEAQKRNVVGSGLLGAEIGSASKLKEFKRFDETIQGPAGKAKDFFFKGIPDALGGLGEFREDVMRLAVFMHNVSRIQRGMAIDSGISDIRNIKDPFDAAAKVARESLGDYGDFTSQSQLLRRTILPFFSFTKANTEWNVRFIKQFGTARGLTGVAARRAALLAARAGAFFAVPAIINAFNKDADDDLDPHTKATWHITLGRDESGRPIVWTSPIGMAEFYHDLGMGEGIGDLMALSTGDKGAVEAMTDMALRPVSRILSKPFVDSGPFVKVPLAAVAGMKTFPNVQSIPLKRRVPTALAETGLNAVPYVGRWMQGREEKPMNELLAQNFGFRHVDYTYKMRRQDEAEDQNRRDMLGGWLEPAVDATMDQFGRSLGAE